MIGFVVGMATVMTLLILTRHLLPTTSPWSFIFFLAPFAVGAILGIRVASHGRRANLPLSQALLSALGLRPADQSK